MTEPVDLLAALQASVDRAREGRKPAAPDLTFCEPSPATTFSRMHIRVVGVEGRLYGGGITGSALCGHSRLSWDVEGPPLILAQIQAQPQDGLVGRTCTACAEAATQLLTEESK